MKRISKRLTYANVMSSIAVFLVLGGATAFAAQQLGKNSVGSKQIKKNAVTAAKIKKNAVTGAKIKNGAVNGAKVQDGSLTGADINLGTLGAVPNATNATNAANAAKTAQIASVFFTGNIGGAPKTVVNLGGLTITASCDGDVQLDATTSVAHSFIAFYTPQDQDTDTNLDFSPGETFDADLGHSQGEVLDLYTIRYTRPDGVNVVVDLQDVDGGEGPVFPGTPQAADCYLGGIATTS